MPGARAGTGCCPERSEYFWGAPRLAMAGALLRHVALRALRLEDLRACGAQKGTQGRPLGLRGAPTLLTLLHIALGCLSEGRHSCGRRSNNDAAHTPSKPTSRLPGPASSGQSAAPSQKSSLLSYIGPGRHAHRSRLPPRRLPQPGTAAQPSRRESTITGRSLDANLRRFLARNDSSLPARGHSPHQSARAAPSPRAQRRRRAETRGGRARGKLVPLLLSSAYLARRSSRRFAAAGSPRVRARRAPGGAQVAGARVFFGASGAGSRIS